MGSIFTSNWIYHQQCGNRTTNKSSFSIVYTKTPNYSIDLVDLHEPKNKNATTCATNYVKFYAEIREQIEKMNAGYKRQADLKRMNQAF